MTTEQKQSAALHHTVLVALVFLMCLGCGGHQDDQQGIHSESMSETEVGLADTGDENHGTAEELNNGSVTATVERSRARSEMSMDSDTFDRAAEPMKLADGVDRSNSELLSPGDGFDNPVNALNSPASFPAGTKRQSMAPAIRNSKRRISNSRLSNRPSPVKEDLGMSKSVAAFGLQPGEELWVIAASDPGKEQKTDSTPNPAIPGSGVLLAKIPEEPKLIPVPLRHTTVTGTIDGYMASVNVKQQFHNPFDTKIEAVYMFPLPQNSAINEFVMKVGDRRIRGVIREREQAEKIYSQARSQGHIASLMTQERPNIFTQKVANLTPGTQIDVDVRYFNTLKWDDGAYEFVFPMVVGPRFNPAGSADSFVGISQGRESSTGNKQEYLGPSERNGRDISLTVDVHAGVDIEHIESVSHLIETEQHDSGHRTVMLVTGDSIPNRDFVLRYQVAGETVKSALMTHQDEHGQYFTMMLYPPAELNSLQRSPMEMVFVVDCSGSMSGQPLAQSKAAVRQALSTLTSGDTFQIIQFSSNASQLGNKPLPATAENVQRALNWLSSLHGDGGTQMIEGIKAALDFPHDEGRFRLVSFLTDGYIGNEQQILTTLHQKRGASRVFSFGVGQSPNRFLMDRMALAGRGAVTYLSLNDNAPEVMNRFMERISHPALTDIDIDWGYMEVEDMYPSRLPDLIVGRPVVLTGRFTGAPSRVRVRGRACMQPVDYAVRMVDDRQKHKAIAAVWARHKIADLMIQATQLPELREQMKQSVLQTALNYNLMSAYTAFIAVDSITRTRGEFGTTVAVPLPVPEGVRYETTLSN